MPRTREPEGDGTISEMAIVDTFTKLIFDQEEAQYDALERHVIRTLRLVDASVAVDNYRDMGCYLRAMGVEEMIQLVGRVRAQLGSNLHCTDTARGRAAILDRRAH